MEIQESVPLRGKTTMRIGGTAAYFAVAATEGDIEQAWRFAQEKQVPIVPLGGGTNTIFADGTIQALVLRIAADAVYMEPAEPQTSARITVAAGKNLAMLINELAEESLDLSPLTGIPGTVGGAVFGNAGQGQEGIWTDTFIESVRTFRNGKWRTLPKKECQFSYRSSVFKAQTTDGARTMPTIIWSATLSVPMRPAVEIQRAIEGIFQHRFASQPHGKTAGSCFKAQGAMPAWKLIDEAGLRGAGAGAVHISQKHANFLINEGEARFSDVVALIERVRSATGQPMEVEMRLVQEDGSCR